MAMVILSQDEDNYFIWKNHFLEFLRSKNKAGFVDGTVGIREPSSPLYQPWKVCNARVKSWMMSSVCENFRDMVRFAEIYQLRQRIATLRQDGDSVAGYFGKLRIAWMELWEYDPLPECACGGCQCEIKKRAEETREKEERYVFLMGLNFEERPKLCENENHVRKSSSFTKPSLRSGSKRRMDDDTEKHAQVI